MPSLILDGGPEMKSRRRMESRIALWIFAEIKFRLELEYFSLCLWPVEVLREKYEFPVSPDSYAYIHGAGPDSIWHSERSTRAAGESFSMTKADLMAASGRREIAFWRLRSDLKLTVPGLSVWGMAWASKYQNSQRSWTGAVLQAISLPRWWWTGLLIG